MTLKRDKLLRAAALIYVKVLIYIPFLMHFWFAFLKSPQEVQWMIQELENMFYNVRVKGSFYSVCQIEDRAVQEYLSHLKDMFNWVGGGGSIKMKKAKKMIWLKVEVGQISSQNIV